MDSNTAASFPLQQWYNERWLALVGVQMVYPTATLPPSKEEEFFELINARSEDVTILPKAIYHVLDNVFDKRATHGTVQLKIAYPIVICTLNKTAKNIKKVFLVIV
jgi:CRISPR/Cas system-associated endonuclease/helicase Cas3